MSTDCTPARKQFVLLLQARRNESTTRGVPSLTLAPEGPWDPFNIAPAAKTLWPTPTALHPCTHRAYPPDPYRSTSKGHLAPAGGYPGRFARPQSTFGSHPIPPPAPPGGYGASPARYASHNAPSPPSTHEPQYHGAYTPHRHPSLSAAIDNMSLGSANDPPLRSTRTSFCCRRSDAATPESSPPPPSKPAGTSTVSPAMASPPSNTNSARPTNSPHLRPAPVRAILPDRPRPPGGSGSDSRQPYNSPAQYRLSGKIAYGVHTNGPHDPPIRGDVLTSVMGVSSGVIRDNLIVNLDGYNMVYILISHRD
ncbi:hypothetical protein M422DRAFT_257417 [Sphaerobolus stellatus SS14]|uniref:Uncharacterized protein n=1 Tax=Sphaerobolus stellatus (strain SS14) TaxID=990650 RepID=A0A0C9U9Q1_SPHS4|nr:hypothetical protein M422DRAFT_257417 [Sphaerobolus stellatus SS14]